MLKSWKYSVAALAVAIAPVPVSAAEIVDVVFTAPTGGVTTKLYSGKVKVKASGTGFSLGPALNDAFYLLSGPSPTSDYYGLGFDTKALTGYQPGRHIANFIDGARPAYNASNVYNFILNTGSVTPTKLYFGVTDGVYGDNGGKFRLEISPIAAVPEPATWAMMILGFGLVGGAMRSRQRQSVRVAYA
jgi:hypothetical protein